VILEENIIACVETMRHLLKVIWMVHTIKIFVLCVGIDAVIKRSTSIIVADDVPDMSTCIRTHMVTHLMI
jgi:hypothetical protein